MCLVEQSWLKLWLLAACWTARSCWSLRLEFATRRFQHGPASGLVQQSFVFHVYEPMYQLS